MTTYDAELAIAAEGILHTYHTQSDILGASKIDTYRDCPLRYRLQYVDKLEVPSKPAMVVGSCVHKALEIAHERKWRAEDAPQAAQVLRDLWRRVIGETTPEGRGDAIARVEKLATQGIPWYLQWRWATGQIDIATEHRWDATVPGTDIQLRGTWDRLYRADGQTVVSDVKSGRYLPRDMDTDLQLTLYSWAYRQTFPGKAEGALEIVGIGLRKVVRTTRTDEQHQQTIEAVVVPVAESIARGDFPPNTNCRYGCQTCNYYNDCPAMGRGRKAA